MTAGTMFLVWLGELITERGIGNGISLIIFAGIVVGFPSLITQGFIDRENLLRPVRESSRAGPGQFRCCPFSCS